MVSHRKGTRKYYAVRNGTEPGVYHTYDDCLAQVKGFKGAIFKSFGTLTEAEAFVAGQGDASAGTPGSNSKIKFYAVHRGIRPGVYRTWDEARAQISGAKMPLQRAFPNLEDAEFFVKHGVVPSASARARKSPTSARSKKSRSAVENEEAQEDEIEEVEDEEVDNSIVPTATKRSRDEVEEEDGEETEAPRTETKTPAAKRQKKAPTPVAPAAEEVEEAAVAEQMAEVKPETKTPAPKKQKKASAAAAEGAPEELDEAAYPPGTGPLPPGATDGFDPRLILTPYPAKNGMRPSIEYKFQDQRDAMKMQPLGRRKHICIDIYTDGSCKANGQGHRAVAGWGVYFGPYHKKNASGPLPGPRQTNQRAELLAINKALAISPSDAHIRIITDSRYAISCVTEWSKRWALNDWKTATGKPVENKDLIEPIIARVDERTSLGVETRFVWVKGHAGDEGNEGADRLAVMGAGMKEDSKGYAEQVKAVKEAEKGIGEGVHQEDLEGKEPPSVADEGAEEEEGKEEVVQAAEEKEVVQAEEEEEEEEELQAEPEVEVDVEGETNADAEVHQEVPESVWADDASAAAPRPEILESVYDDGTVREMSREATEEL